MSEFVVGQRWISHTETNLGLGIVAEVMHRRIVMSFPAAGEQRVYATNNSPLGRIVYKQDDQIKDNQGHSFKVVDVNERAGLVFYACKNVDGEDDLLPEIELDSFVQFNTPKDRLLAGQVDPLKFFSLRQDSLEYLRQYQQSNVQGLLGPRIQLLAHQLYIAQRVASRNEPRVLLADEVGLGKTIEAGLIIHQQLQTGLAQRVLILLPDSLLHQWLVEMRRRFNLPFSVLNEEMCEGAFDPEENPFEASQLALCPLSFLVDNPERMDQALLCDWDLLVVDEAHHLEWSEEDVSVEYQCVEDLAQVARGVLLLTATPEQLGMEGHFARLRLLDPDRYYDLNKFLAEENNYQGVNDLVHQVINARETFSALPKGLENYIEAQELAHIVEEHDSGDIEPACDKLLSALLDRHGTGRVLFRNTRAAISGFPERVIFPHPLIIENPTSQTATSWYPEDEFGGEWLQQDPRIPWLLQWLEEHNSEQVLLICAQASTAIELEKHLRTRHAVRSAIFHEGMSLVARDRAAAYFADEDQAAQILICSEIGSEGRNFQFVHHIILFDLPINPDLLEQRIGRLDRIGQRYNICIHVPFYENSEQHILFDWYDQGLDAFSQTSAIGHAVFTQFESQLMHCLETKDRDATQILIADTKAYAKELRQKLQQGRNRLLELNSCRTHEAETIIENVVEAESRKDLETFLERSCDQLGINIETHSANSIILRPSENMRCGLLPGLEDDGISATYSRDTALQREDMHFLTWEHPTVKSALEHILNSNHGNVAFATLKLQPLKQGTLLLETFFTVQCIAPSKLRLQRYLPAHVIRVLVSIDGKDFNELLPGDQLNKLIRSVPMQAAREVIKNTAKDIEKLSKHAQRHAKKHQALIAKQVIEKMQQAQSKSLLRLKALAKVNPNIRASEISALEEETQQLEDYLSSLELKADSVRLIMSI